jgi:hypothetical protein
MGLMTGTGAVLRSFRVAVCRSSFLFGTVRATAAEPGGGEVRF